MSSRLSTGRLFISVLAVALATSAAAQSESTTRKPIPPSKADITATNAQLRIDYAAAIRSLRTYQQRNDFAHRLLNDAADSQVDDARRFAMLRMAQQQATLGRAPQLALRAVDALEKSFQFDGRPMRLDLLRSTVSAVRTNDQRREAIDATLAFAETSLASKQLDEVESLVEALPLLAKRLRDNQRRTRAEQMLARVRQAAVAQRRAEDAQRRLANSPDDVDANYTVALASFETSQWNVGVRALAKATRHPELASLAQTDLKGADRTQQFIELADRWTQAAVSRSELGGLRGRALYWIHRAIPRLEGDQRKAMEQRATALTAELKSWKADREQVAANARQPKRKTGNRTYNKQADSNAKPADAATAEQAAPKPKPIELKVATRFDAHKGAANSVAFHPKSAWLVSGGEDGLIKIWSLETRQLVATLEGHRGPVNAIAFSPDGRRLASVGADKTLRLWKLPSAGRTISDIPDPVVLQGHATQIRDVAFSHKGDYMITCADDHRVAFWDVKSGRSVARQEHKGIVYAVTSCPIDYSSASVAEDGKVQLWNRLAAGPNWIAHQGKATAIAFGPSGKLLASGGEDRLLYLWNLKSGKRDLLSTEASLINCIEFAPSGAQLATASRDRTVKIWERKQGRQLAVTNGLTNEALEIAYSSDARYLAAASRSGKVLLWDVGQLQASD